MSDKYRDDVTLVKAMRDASVLVIGDIMLDRFIYGSVERISPESPVPVLSVTRENMMLGGAGNTLSNLLHLGVKAKILSVIGADVDGANIKDLLRKQGIAPVGLVESKDRPTIVKTRFLAGHQQLLRTDFERVEPISAPLAQRLLEKAEALLAGVQVVILSDYGKGLLTAAFVKALIALAKARDILVLVDPKGTDYSVYEGADIVTPNKKELAQATGGMAVESDAQIVQAARHLMTTNIIACVVATRSKEGMSVIQHGRDSEPVHIKSASDIEVFDVSGAGDSVIATLAASLAVGTDLVTAASLANIAGSIVVSKVGTAPIRADELLAALQKQADQPRFERMRQAPVLDWNAAQEEILRWKARGLRVGFTNGCFDILHFGHVTYLNEARTRCDRLVIGLNCDQSVRLLKGETRPVHDEHSRAAVLAALGCVDMVVLFGAEKVDQDNTACALLDILQPDIYFKGGDYVVADIPEAPTIQRHGGVVDVMPVYEGHSTTRSLAKMH